MARPSSYKDEYADTVFKLCLLGATDSEIGDFYGVSEQTVNAWKKAHPAFLESLKAGKQQADANVAQSLYQTALDGNTTAQIFWLKNRNSRQWRDKAEIDHQSSDGTMSPTTIKIVAPEID